MMMLPLAEWFGLFVVPLKWVFPMEHGIRLLEWSFRCEEVEFPWLGQPDKNHKRGDPGKAWWPAVTG